MTSLARPSACDTAACIVSRPLAENHRLVRSMINTRVVCDVYRHVLPEVVHRWNGRQQELLFSYGDVQRGHGSNRTSRCNVRYSIGLQSWIAARGSMRRPPRSPAGCHRHSPSRIQRSSESTLADQTRIDSAIRLQADSATAPPQTEHSGRLRRLTYGAVCCVVVSIDRARGRALSRDPEHWKKAQFRDWSAATGRNDRCCSCANSAKARGS